MIKGKEDTKVEDLSGEFYFGRWRLARTRPRSMVQELCRLEFALSWIEVTIGERILNMSGDSPTRSQGGPGVFMILNKGLSNSGSDWEKRCILAL